MNLSRMAAPALAIPGLAACGLSMVILVSQVDGEAAGTIAADHAVPPDAAAIRVLIDAGRFPEAEAGARALVAAREAAEGPDSVACAQALDLLVEALNLSGRWVEAETRALAVRAVTIKEARLDPESPELATSLLNLAATQRLTGGVLEARKNSERALRIREQTFGAMHLGVAKALSDLAWSMMDSGDLLGAVAANERALAIRERLLGSEHPLLADSLRSLGSVVRNAGDFERAAALHGRALRIRRAVLPAGHPDIALSLSDLADAMHRNGDFAGALPLYAEARRLREQAASPDLPRLSEVYINMADLLRELGDLEAAGPLYERAHQIRAEVMRTRNTLTGVSHQSLGAFLQYTGRYGEARRHLESAVAIWDQTLPPGHPLQAAGRHDLGSLMRQMGDLEAAQRLLQESVDKWQASAPDHPFCGDACALLGAVLRDLGETADARLMLDRALDILSKRVGAEHPRYGEVLLERARLDWMEGKDSAALDGALTAEEILRTSLRSATRGLSEGEALRYQNIMVSGLDLAFSILDSGRPGTLEPSARGAAFTALARSRALVLDEMAMRHRGLVRTNDPAVARLAGPLEQARRKYARLLVAGPDPRYAAAYPGSLTGARLDMERAERALAAASAAFLTEQQRQNVSLGDISRALPPETTLVSYVAFKRSDRLATSRPGTPAYLALVLRPGAGTPIVVPLGPAEPLEAGIEGWRRAVSLPPQNEEVEAAYAREAQSIRKLLWDPIAEHLGGSTRVLLVPDGVIHAISLATLVDGTGRFLLESGPTVHYLSSERDLLAATGTAATGRGLLALGGPDFEAPSQPEAAVLGDPRVLPAQSLVTRSDNADVAAGASCSDWAALNFPPLPGAAAEAEQVRELWMRRSGGQRTDEGSTVLLTGAGANEENLIREAPGKRVLHLATHAFLVPSRCEVGPSEKGAAPLSGPGGRLESGTPLRVFGLAVAGANRRNAEPSANGADDGLLTGEEVAALDLSEVELVVLSGCQTGAGLARAGEGILGLRRSFQVAGARALVLSLWPVSDNDTQAWMGALYEARRRGESTADSLRQASRQILQERRVARVSPHPFFWGAFVAAGEWR